FAGIHAQPVEIPFTGYLGDGDILEMDTFQPPVILPKLVEIFLYGFDKDSQKTMARFAIDKRIDRIIRAGPDKSADLSDCDRGLAGQLGQRVSHRVDLGDHFSRDAVKYGSGSAAQTFTADL